MTGKDSLAFSYSIIKTLQEVATARSDTEPTNDHDLLLGMAALLHKAELYESYREVKSENRNFIKLIKKRGIDRVVGIPPFAVGPVGINVITQRGAIDLALDTAQRVIAYNYYPDDAPPRHYIAASQRRGSAGA